MDNFLRILRTTRIRHYELNSNGKSCSSKKIKALQRFVNTVCTRHFTNTTISIHIFSLNRLVSINSSKKRIFRENDRNLTRKLIRRWDHRRGLSNNDFEYFMYIFIFYTFTTFSYCFSSVFKRILRLQLNYTVLFLRNVKAEGDLVVGNRTGNKN